MALQDKRPCFNKAPIGKVDSLSLFLSVPESDLLKIAGSVDKYWKQGKLLKKKNGDLRPTSDAERPLKDIHEKINQRLLKQVTYPTYLLGGIADKKTPRDYKRHATIHSGKKILISEDIKDFFPNTTDKVVFNIWKRFFNFSPEVARVLTSLTTLNGFLPQGWKTSGYLANLAFWDVESKLVEEFEKRGFSYSRLMDDITVSSRAHISIKQKHYIVSEIYGMLFAKGYSPKRTKHQIMTSSKKMEVTGLTVNSTSPKLPRKERDNIRAAVHRCENHSMHDRNSKTYETLWNHVSGKVGKLKRFHLERSAKLRKRLNRVKPT